MSDFRVASRYAKSLFSLAIDEKIEDKLKEDMLLIAETCKNSYDLRVTLKNPIVKYDKKLNILKRLFEGKVDKIVLRFIELLTRKNRANILPEMAEIWGDMYNEYKNIISARITSAIPLTPGEKEKVLKAITNYSGKKVILEESIKKDLIGGFILNIKDLQLDNSISGQIKQLKRKFLNRV